MTIEDIDQVVFVLVAGHDARVPVPVVIFKCGEGGAMTLSAPPWALVGAVSGGLG